LKKTIFVPEVGLLRTEEACLAWEKRGEGDGIFHVGKRGKLGKVKFDNHVVTLLEQ